MLRQNAAYEVSVSSADEDPLKGLNIHCLATARSVSVSSADEDPLKALSRPSRTARSSFSILCG